MLSCGGHTCFVAGIFVGLCQRAHLLCSAPNCSLMLDNADGASLQNAVRASHTQLSMRHSTSSFSRPRDSEAPRGSSVAAWNINSLVYSLLGMSLDLVRPSSYTSATGSTKTFLHSDSCSNLANWVKHELSTRHMCEILLNLMGVRNRFKIKYLLEDFAYACPLKPSWLQDFTPKPLPVKALMVTQLWQLSHWLAVATTA